jgi:hypothetical protein
VKRHRILAASTATAFIVSAVMSFASAAHAVTYQTSGFALGGLGDTIYSGYDYLTGSAVQGTLGSSIVLNDLAFTAGINATVPQYYPSKYSITETLTIGATQQQINIPFALDISYSDTVTISEETFSFVDGNTVWQLVVNGMLLGPNAGGTQTAQLTARVSEVSQTPLPAALPLFASGLGGLGLFAWWRKRKTAATAA